MAGIDIQERVKVGLARAIDRTGGNPAQVVILIRKTGGGTPENPTPVIDTAVPLVDAVVSGYDNTNFDQSLIQTGDRKLVTNGNVEIKQNDTVSIDDDYFIVISVDVKNPAGVPLAYISQLRPKGNAP